MTISIPPATSSRRVLTRYLDALVAADLETISDSFAADAVWTLHGDLPLAGTRRGRPEIMAFLLDAGTLYREGTQTFEFGDILVDGDRAVLEWRVRGVASAGGLSYDNDYCAVFEIRDGRIASVREFLDTLHAAQTLFPELPPADAAGDAMTASPVTSCASGPQQMKRTMLAWTPSPSADPAAALRLATLERQAPAPDEATVSVAAYSVNRGETFLLERPPQGWRPGKDVAGTIVRAAADGTGPEVGARVVGHPEHGGWAEEVNVPVSRLAVLPASIGFDTAAALPLAGLTALGLLDAVGFLGGQRVLMTGASGGVGHYFTELAAAQGAMVTVVVSNPRRAERLMQLGATAMVTSASEAVGTFDVVLDSVGGDDFGELWSRLPTRGHLVWFGQASRTPARLDFLDWRGGSSATLTKFSYADSERSPSVGLATLVRLVSGGHLHPEIDRVVDWRQTPDVLAALLAREIRGNAVLTVTS